MYIIKQRLFSFFWANKCAWVHSMYAYNLLILLYNHLTKSNEIESQLLTTMFTQ